MTMHRFIACEGLSPCYHGAWTKPNHILTEATFRDRGRQHHALRRRDGRMGCYPLVPTILKNGFKYPSPAKASGLSLSPTFNSRSFANQIVMTAPSPNSAR